MCLILFRGVAHMLRWSAVLKIFYDLHGLVYLGKHMSFGISQRVPAKAQVSLLFSTKNVRF